MKTLETLFFVILLFSTLGRLGQKPFPLLPHSFIHGHSHICAVKRLHAPPCPRIAGLLGWLDNVLDASKQNMKQLRTILYCLYCRLCWGLKFPAADGWEVCIFDSNSYFFVRRNVKLLVHVRGTRHCAECRASNFSMVAH